jgi:hypothetical protein
VIAEEVDRPMAGRFANERKMSSSDNRQVFRKHYVAVATATEGDSFAIIRKRLLIALKRTT